MGGSNTSFRKLTLSNSVYEIQSKPNSKTNYGGFGNQNNKQDGDQFRGYFLKIDNKPRISGFIYMVRHACNQQTYAGFKYPNDATCSGRICYQRESETANCYKGTHINMTARVGFGQYKEYRKWSYLGFWNMQQMNGFGMLKHNFTRERYTGEFKDNNIDGWGEYYRVVRNKVLRAKGNRKACKGTEYILIWSKFQTFDQDDMTASKNVDIENDLKYLKIERDSNEAFLAFPRIEEIDFQGRTCKYKLRLVTEYQNEVAIIKRKGADLYSAMLMKSKKSIPLKRKDVKMLPCYNDFLLGCVPKIEKAFDPDFIIDEAVFHIEKVLKINGFGCRYLLSSELADDGAVIGGGLGVGGVRLTTSYRGPNEERRLYIAKGYIFSDARQCRVYQKELKMLKKVSQAGIGAKIASCHEEESHESVVLTYDNKNMHEQLRDGLEKIRYSDATVFKFMIITENLSRGEFLDVLLGFKAAQGAVFRATLKPYERFVIIRKLLEVYQKLEELQIYHGQIFPCHIYVEGYRDKFLQKSPQEWKVRLVDFSQAVDVSSPELASRFECAVDSDIGLPEWRDPYNRFYLPRFFECEKENKPFQHPLLQFYSAKHGDLTPDKLEFDIRQTDLYSLSMILLLLCSPDVNTESAVKKMLANHTNWRLRVYDNAGEVKVPKRGHNQFEDDEAFRKPVYEAATNLKSAYSKNRSVKTSICNVIQAITETIIRAAPEYEKGKKNKRVPLIGRLFAQLKQKVDYDLVPVIDSLKKEAFQPNPTMKVLFRGTEKVVNPRPSFFGNYAMDSNRQMEAEKMKNLFDKFFGEEWVHENDQNFHLKLERGKIPRLSQFYREDEKEDQSRNNLEVVDQREIQIEEEDDSDEESGSGFTDQDESATNNNQGGVNYQIQINPAQDQGPAVGAQVLEQNDNFKGISRNLLDNMAQAQEQKKGSVKNRRTSSKKEKKKGANKNLLRPNMLDSQKSDQMYDPGSARQRQVTVVNTYKYSVVNRDSEEEDYEEDEENEFSGGEYSD